MSEKPPQQNATAAAEAVSKKEIEDLRARLAELEAMRERFLRAAADFDNAKKRLVRERDEFVKFSQEGLIRELLPVLDNFERALAHAGQDPSTGPLIAGIQMVFKQVSEILKNQGLKRLGTVGQKFDPHQHEAVAHESGPGPEDEVVEEIEPGYVLHGRLLRAAKVKVRRGEAAPPAGEEEKPDEIT